MAESSNCKTGKYARDAFAAIRNKLLAGTPASNSNSEGGEGHGIAEKESVMPKGKAKATPRKRKTGMQRFLLYNGRCANALYRQRRGRDAEQEESDSA